jgi:hypothetical protein
MLALRVGYGFNNVSADILIAGGVVSLLAIAVASQRGSVLDGLWPALLGFTSFYSLLGAASWSTPTCGAGELTVGCVHPAFRVTSIAASVGLLVALILAVLSFRRPAR